MKSIFFEMGVIDPRGNSFDHHDVISHNNAFIAKMSSVQLLEKIMVTGCDFDISSVTLNHVGHLDDMVLHAIEFCIEENKLRSLYAFAARISALDSLGPAAYKCLQDSDRDLVKKVYDTFQDNVAIAAAEADVDGWSLPLEIRVECSKKAGRVLCDNLSIDEYTEPEPWIPNPDDYSLEKLEGGIFVMETHSSKCNPLRASGYFYNQGCKILIGYTPHTADKRMTVSVCGRSSYDVDLTPLWAALTRLEESDLAEWGGHSGAGGSPRKSDTWDGGTTLSIEKIITVVEECI